VDDSSRPKRLARPSNVVVFELGGKLPRARKSLPHLYVTTTSRDPQDELHRLQDGAGPGWTKGDIRRVRQDLTPDLPPTRSRQRLDNRLRRTVDGLRSKGYAVNNQIVEYRVYVIDLDPDIEPALSRRGRRNKVIYVGYTSKSIEERYRQHKREGAGSRSLASRVVYKRGTGINRQLSLATVLFTKHDALLLEERLSKQLENRGYRVLGDGVTRARSRKQRRTDRSAAKGE